MRRSERDLAKAARVTTRRSLLLGGMMTSVVGVLGFRMWQLGVRDAEEYYLLAEENRINLRLVRPDRGRIFDRAGKIVADNEHTYRITLVKEEARDVDDVLAKLQRLLGLTGEVIDRTIKRGTLAGHAPGRVDQFFHLAGRQFLPVGCASCAKTGYRGRVGVFEIFHPKPLHDLIVGRVSNRELTEKAIEQGMRPLAKAGWLKVAAGLTTIDELVRNLSSNE